MAVGALVAFGAVSERAIAAIGSIPKRLMTNARILNAERAGPPTIHHENNDMRHPVLRKEADAHQHCEDDYLKLSENCKR